MQQRRQIREHKAYMQSVLNQPESATAWTQIAPLLDNAMAHLGGKDYDAVVLRFFEGKTFKDVGAAMGGSEDGAKKRVDRALEKLRRFFVKHGISSTTVIIAGALSAHSIQAAPLTLAKSVTASALTKAAVAGGSTLTLGQATFIAMKTKIVAAAIAVALVIGAGTGLITHFKTLLRHRSSAVVPFTFPNDAFALDKGKNDYLVDADPVARRTPASAPAMHIKYVGAPTLPATDKLIPATNGTDLRFHGSCVVNYQVTNGSPLLGQHIRISGWLKAADVQRWAGATMMIIRDRDKHVCTWDDMKGRALRGATDWQQVEFITDVPDEPCLIYFGPVLYNSGELWSDGFQIDLAPASARITDNREWGLWSGDPTTDFVSVDPATKHEGHSTVCLTRTLEGKLPPKTWMWWGQCFRDPDKYRGHTLQLSGWVKTENVSIRLNPTLRPIEDSNNNKLLAKDSMGKDFSLAGTRDWTPFSVVCVIPKKTQRIDTGFVLWGGGKAWIDKESLKYEIIK